MREQVCNTSRAPHEHNDQWIGFIGYTPEGEHTPEPSTFFTGSRMPPDNLPKLIPGRYQTAADKRSRRNQKSSGLADPSSLFKSLRHQPETPIPTADLHTYSKPCCARSTRRAVERKLDQDFTAAVRPRHHVNRSL